MDCILLLATNNSSPADDRSTKEESQHLHTTMATPPPARYTRSRQRQKQQQHGSSSSGSSSSTQHLEVKAQLGSSSMSVNEVLLHEAVQVLRLQGVQLHHAVHAAADVSDVPQGSCAQPASQRHPRLYPGVRMAPLVPSIDARCHVLHEQTPSQAVLQHSWGFKPADASLHATMCAARKGAATALTAATVAAQCCACGLCRLRHYR
jgi:hypothetical protein